MNQNYQMILSEQDVIESWLSGRKPANVITYDVEPINIYNEWCERYDIDDKINATEENTSQDYLATRSNTVNWNMPDNYKSLDIRDYILGLCPDENKQRCLDELDEFEKRSMFPVLKFLIYMKDTCEANDVVLGVGRGSSVASYVLYLMGIHKVDSIKYDLNIKEFLK